MAIFWWLLLSQFLVVALLVWTFFARRFSYWRRKGVPGPRPSVPLGNIGEAFTKRKPMSAIFRSLYESHKHEPFVGLYMAHRPALLVNDLDLVKAMLVRDFAHFTDHGFDFNRETQPLVNHLFNVNGARWRALRNKLTPAFTSSRMKAMFALMDDCGRGMIRYLNEDVPPGEPCDMKEIIAKFSTDVIVSCAFGIDSDCFRNPESEFRVLGKTVFDFDTKANLALVLAILAPELSRKLDLRIVKESLENFFIGAIESTIKYRTENKVVRNDMMHLIMRLMNNEDIEDEEGTKPTVASDIPDVHLTPLEVAAQAFGFFVDGFETTSTTSSFVFHELGKNPKVQSRLREEIDSALARHGGKITYDAVMEMNYLTQVIDETLRVYPVVPQMFRLCTQDYVIPNTNVAIEKDTLIVISNEAIQMDPDIFEDPEVFDPDNFSPEKKASRHHFAHLPFGEGPRQCIGMRFALLSLKLGLINILKNFEVTLAGDGKLHLAPNASFTTTPKHVLVHLKPRT